MEHRAKKTSIVRTVGEWNDLELDVAFVIVERYSCNEMELSVLNVSRLTSLQELSIGEGCFRSVEEVLIEGLSNLKRVVIGENSFTEGSGAFILSSCSALEALRIGNHSFASYSTLVIEDVPLLTEVVIPSNSFRNVDQLDLIGLHELVRVVISENSMTNKEGDFLLQNCTSVVELRVGSGSMRSFRSIDVYDTPFLEVIEIGEGCFGETNRFELIGLSELESVVIGSNSFSSRNGNSVMLLGCSVRRVTFGDGCFAHFAQFVMEGDYSLEELVIGDGCFNGTSFAIKG